MNSMLTTDETLESPVAEPPKLRRRSLDGPLPMTYPQQAFALSYDSVEIPQAQHMVVARKLVGALSVPNLQACVDQLTARHGILRAYYRTIEGRTHVFIRERVEIPIHQEEVNEPTPEAAETAARERIRELGKPRFDLRSGPLMRVALLRLAADQHIVAFMLHHSICDGWSVAVLLRDVAALYDACVRGTAPKLPPLALQYTDYATWARGTLDSPAGNKHLAFWKDFYAGVRDPFFLPHDHPEPSSSEETPGSPNVYLSPETMRAVRDFARAEQTTASIVVLAAFAVTLARWSGRDDVLIALVHFNRQNADTWAMIGCFIQVWGMRVNLSGQPAFVDVVRQVRETNARVQNHLLVPFMMTKQMLAEASDEKPLLHITFNYLPAPEQTEDPAWSESVKASPFPVLPLAATLDERRGEKLSINCYETVDALRALIQYSPTRFFPRTIDLFWKNMEALLASVTADRECATRPLVNAPLAAIAGS